MTHLEAVFLGILQGITEFLPISSSGHLILAESFLKVSGANLVFDVFLHLGTLLAVLIFFAKDWKEMLFPPAGRSRKLLFYILLATVPGALAGFFLEGLVEAHFRQPERVALMLAVMTLPLLLAELLGPRKLSLEGLNLPKALAIGCAQGLAVIPGTSRSGITMSCGLFVGLTREAAARFSFLLSAPIIAGAGFYETLKLFHHGGHIAGPYISGFLGAFISGYLVIAWLLKFLRTHSFYPFIIYRLALAALVYVFFKL